MNKENKTELKKRMHELNASTNIYTYILESNSTDMKESKLYDVKDNMMIKDIYVTGASSTNLIKSPYNAAVVDLLNAAGYRVVALTNMDELGVGSWSRFAKNGRIVWNEGPQQSPGGSSGGAAVSALKITTISLGTDTGGSCRFPAQICRIHGFKPTFGSFSRFGIYIYDDTDTVGIFSRSVKEIYNAAKILSVYDERDSNSITNNMNSGASSYSIVALNENLYNKEQKEFLNQLKKRFDVVDIDLSINPEFIDAIYEIISAAGFYSNSSRFSIARLNDKNSIEFDSYQDVVDKSLKMFGPNCLSKIMLAEYVMHKSDGVNAYELALSARGDLISNFIRTIDNAKIIIYPVVNLEEYHYIYANLVGIPSLFVSLRRETGIIGLNIMSAHRCENIIFDFAEKIADLIYNQQIDS